MQNDNHQSHTSDDELISVSGQAATRVILGQARWRLQESAVMLLDFMQPTINRYEALEALRQAQNKIDEWLDAHG